MKRLDRPPRPHAVFRSAAIAATAIAVALGIGVLGYRYFNGETWIDALLDASMILGGMGPVSPLNSDAAKLFAAFYALFSGLTFIAIAGVVSAPWIHFVLHRLHADDRDEE
jgi:predicted membrane-bound spermidine synthase